MKLYYLQTIKSNPWHLVEMTLFCMVTCMCDCKPLLAIPPYHVPINWMDARIKSQYTQKNVNT